MGHNDSTDYRMSRCNFLGSKEALFAPLMAVQNKRTCFFCHQPLTGAQAAEEAAKAAQA